MGYLIMISLKGISPFQSTKGFVSLFTLWSSKVWFTGRSVVSSPTQPPPFVILVVSERKDNTKKKNNVNYCKIGMKIHDWKCLRSYIKFRRYHIVVTHISFIGFKFLYLVTYSNISSLSLFFCLWLEQVT